MHKFFYLLDSSIFANSIIHPAVCYFGVMLLSCTSCYQPEIPNSVDFSLHAVVIFLFTAIKIPCVIERSSNLCSFTLSRSWVPSTHCSIGLMSSIPRCMPNAQQACSIFISTLCAFFYASLCWFFWK